MVPLKMLETSWAFGSLYGNRTEDLSFSTNITSLFTGRFKYRATDPTLFDAPSINLTLGTNPSLPLFVAMIFAIGHLFSSASSFNSTISPTLQLPLGEFHFCLLRSVINTSFFHRSQNSLEMCYTLLQCLWE